MIESETAIATKTRTEQPHHAAAVFGSELKDIVFGGLPGGRFGNTRQARAEGVELERVWWMGASFRR